MKRVSHAENEPVPVLPAAFRPARSRRRSKTRTEKEKKMFQGALLIVIYLAAVLSPHLLLLGLHAHSWNTFIYETGRSFALAGFAILIFQPVLAARLKTIERPFGMDMVIRFHKAVAVFALVLLACHPVLVAWGGRGFSLLYSVALPWYVLLGKLGLLLLLIHIVLAVFSGRLNLTFEGWRRYHFILAPIILVVAFLHSWNTGGDLAKSSLRTLWVILLTVAVLAYAWHKLVRPAALRRKPYRVTGVTQETRDVWTVELTPPEGRKRYSYVPGQFHFITFLRGRNLPEEEHHWTISSSPTRGERVTSTIKESGDFTSTIGETRQGDQAVVHGPFGRFSYVFHPEDRELVFIAGGIGITPLMAMLRHMHDNGDKREVTLIYANKTEEDIVFRDELAEMEQKGTPSLRVHHVLSRAGEEWEGETGYVDKEKIRRFCGEGLQKKAFYIVTPPKMTEKMLEALEALGVGKNQIRMERFSL
jgi:predicted ferric reductase